MANGFIGQVNIGQDTHLIGSTLFGICNTKNYEVSGGSNTKQVTLQSNTPFNETTGITLHIKFTYENTETSSENLKLQILGKDSAYTTARPIKNYNGPITWNAGAIISFTFDGSEYVINSSAIDGSSIQNLSLGNIDNEGKLNTASSLVVTNSSKEITTGATFSEAITTQTTAHKFLREDGSWSVPSYTAAYTLPLAANGTRGGIQIGYSSSGNNYAVQLSNEKAFVNVPWTDTKVTQTSKTDNVAYKFLFTTSASPTSGNAYGAAYATSLSYTPESRTLAITGTSSYEGKITLSDGTTTGTLTGTQYSGNAATASAIAWSGISSKPTTLSGYGITDALSNSATITIAGNTVSLNSGNLTSDTLRTSLGLSQALKFKGITTQSNMDEDFNGVPTGISNDYVPEIGDVILDSDNKYEYVCVGKTTTGNTTTYTWEQLGDGSSYALKDEVIYNSLLTTAGDIIIGTTTNDNKVVPTRLGVGSQTDGYVLTIDSSSHLPTWKANVASSALYVNATQGGAQSDAAVNSNSTYIHFYNDSTKQSTITLTPSGGTSITADANKVITISSEQYWAVNGANALTGLSLTYSGLQQDEAVTNSSNTAKDLGYVNNGILYIKSIYYSTTSVTTSITTTAPT